MADIRDVDQLFVGDTELLEKVVRQSAESLESIVGQYYARVVLWVAKKIWVGVSCVQDGTMGTTGWILHPRLCDSTQSLSRSCRSSRDTTSSWQLSLSSIISFRRLSSGS